MVIDGTNPPTESKFRDEVILAIIKAYSMSNAPLSTNEYSYGIAMESGPMVVASAGVEFATRGTAVNALIAHFYHHFASCY